MTALSALPAFFDAHGTAIEVIASAVVLFTLAFIATMEVIDRRKHRAAVRFHDKSIGPANRRVDRKHRGF